MDANITDINIGNTNIDELLRSPYLTPFKSMENVENIDNYNSISFDNLTVGNNSMSLENNNSYCNENVAAINYNIWLNSNIIKI